jgi:hypothetical protein
MEKFKFKYKPLHIAMFIPYVQISNMIKLVLNFTKQFLYKSVYIVNNTRINVVNFADLIITITHFKKFDLLMVWKIKITSSNYKLQKKNLFKLIYFIHIVKCPRKNLDKLLSYN